MTNEEYSTLKKQGFTELLEDAKIRLLRKKQKNDFTGFKKLGVTIRTSSSLQYGWVDRKFKTEVDTLWWNRKVGSR